MATVASEPKSRLTTRIPASVQSVLAEAAAFLGVPLNSFIVARRDFAGHTGIASVIPQDVTIPGHKDGLTVAFGKMTVFAKNARTGEKGPDGLLRFADALVGGVHGRKLSLHVQGIGIPLRDRKEEPKEPVSCACPYQ